MLLTGLRNQVEGDIQNMTLHSDLCPVISLQVTFLFVLCPHLALSQLSWFFLQSQGLGYRKSHTWPLTLDKHPEGFVRPSSSANK